MTNRGSQSCATTLLLGTWISRSRTDTPTFKSSYQCNKNTKEWVKSK